MSPRTSSTLLTNNTNISLSNWSPNLHVRTMPQWTWYPPSWKSSPWSHLCPPRPHHPLPLVSCSVRNKSTFPCIYLFIYFTCQGVQNALENTYSSQFCQSILHSTDRLVSYQDNSSGSAAGSSCHCPFVEGREATLLRTSADDRDRKSFLKVPNCSEKSNQTNTVVLPLHSGSMSLTATAWTIRNRSTASLSAGHAYDTSIHSRGRNAPMGGLYSVYWAPVEIKSVDINIAAQWNYLRVNLIVVLN